MRKLFFFLLIMSAVSSLSAQQKIWLDKSFKWTNDSTHAFRYAIVSESENKLIQVEEFTLDGQKTASSYYLKYVKDPHMRIREGIHTYYYPNGKDSLIQVYRNNKIEGQSTTYYPDGSIHFTKSYKDGYLDGEFVQYYADGKLRRKEYYLKGRCTRGELYAEDGRELEHEPYQVMPQFPGGQNKFMDVVAQTLQYPKLAAQQKLEGNVLIRFFVDTDGKMKYPYIVKESYPELNEEAMRTFNEIAAAYTWMPARRDGEVIRIKYTVPVVFKIPQKLK